MNSIFEKLNHYFVSREYQRIPTDQETVTMYATFNKSSLYLINVIDLVDNYRIDIDKYHYYKEITKNQFKKARASKVILLNLVLVEKPETLYSVLNIEPQLEDDFIDVNWIIDTEKGELVIPKKQVNNVLDFKQEIESVLGHRENPYIQLPIRKRLAPVTCLLIFMNVLTWVLMERATGSLESNLVDFGALYGPLIFQQHEYWRLFSATFVHVGASHLLFNTFSLFVFGTRLEKYLSVPQFLIVYLLSGFMGCVASLGLQMISGTYNIAAGASGAIYGLIGSIMVSAKLSGKPIAGLNAYTMATYFIMGIVLSVLSPNIDTAAHVGGFITGALVTLVLLYSHKKDLKTE